MHILSCSEIPVYAFFGPTNWKRAHAIGQKKHVITLYQTDKEQNKSCQDLGMIKTEDVMLILKRDGLI